MKANEKIKKRKPYTIEKNQSTTTRGGKREKGGGGSKERTDGKGEKEQKNNVKK